MVSFDALKPQKRTKTITFTARLSPDQHAKVQQVAHILGCDTSKALRSILDAVQVGEPWGEPTLEDVEREEASYVG